MSITHSDHELLQHCLGWLSDGHSVELVTVARTWGSSPRPVGSLAAVRDDGVLVGSVSGGCVEKQLAESYRGEPRSRVSSHRISDAEARRFGLSCGGSLELVFEHLTDAEPIATLLGLLDQRHRVLRVTRIGEEQAHLEETTDRAATFQFDGTTLQRVFGPGWRLLLIGAGQLSRYTAEFALALDYEVIVCDPRSEFRDSWQVSGCQLVADLPDEAVIRYALDSQSAVLALTHDPNLDDMALLEALPGDTFYVGALGSRRNYEGRCRRLAALGLTPADIARLHGPIGLPIGSRTSAEIAVSIVAQLVQVRNPATEGDHATL